MAPRMTRPPRRVFIGMIEVGGYYRALGEGLRALNVRTDVIDVGAHPFHYGTLAGRPRPIAFAESVARHREGHRRGGRRWRFRLWTVAHRATLLGLLPWALARYDTFIFGFSTTFAGTRDLPLFRWFRKRVVMVYHGTDVRPPYMDGADMDPATGSGVAEAIALTRRKVARVRRAERFATTLVSHPLYAQFFRRRSVSYLALGVPMRPPSAVMAMPHPSGTDDAALLHAPSNPAVKGTAVIRAAVAEITGSHPGVTYHEIAGRPNAEVLEAIEAADAVVDQAFSDLPYSIFAAEAAVRGRPVVIAGYGGAFLVRLLGGMPPVQWSEPEQLGTSLAALIEDPGRRVALAARGLVHLAAWQPLDVASRFLRVLTDDTDPAWWYEPLEYAYELGCGLSRERVTELVRGVVAAGGPPALGVGHNPALEAALLRLAAG